MDKDKINEADVVLNRINVALARSQRIINSWLPPKTQEEEATTLQDDNDDDFKPMAEEGGIGSNAAYDDGRSPARSLQRKRLASDDKLLEQLLGKKAAQAHRKAQASKKSMSVSKHAAPKPLTSRPKYSREVQSEDEEDAGRSAAFKSRSSGKRKTNLEASQAAGMSSNVTADVDGIGVLESFGGDHESAASDEETRQKPSKRKANSYLDELLTQKAKKRKKKKKHRGDVSS